jgi:hypothetical protein
MKPANCFHLERGDRIIKVLDFGIAKVAHRRGPTADAR